MRYMIWGKKNQDQGRWGGLCTYGLGPAMALQKAGPALNFSMGVMFSFFFPSVEGNLMKVTALKYIADTHVPVITCC
jgi:hypothetical protein